MATGRLGQAYSLGEGLLKQQKMKLSDGSGLIEYYLNEGIPAISLVNIKKLCLNYALSYDSSDDPQVGLSNIYYKKSIF